MTEYIVDTFGIVQDFADLHGDMNTPLYRAIMDVMVSRQREEIVRCKDCRFCGKGMWGNETFPVCRRGLHTFQVTWDGFCSQGVRKENHAG